MSIAEQPGVATAEDVDDLVLGLTLLSTGGGGLPERGRRYLNSLLDDGHVVTWIALDGLPREALVATVFGMGSIAPHAGLDAEERARRGFPADRVPRPGVRAVRELERLLGSELAAIIPFELGGFNTTVAIDAAARLGLPLVDGDLIGRALPELSQALPAAHGIPAHPLAICDDWGSVLHLTDCPSTAVAEHIGKMVSIVTKTPDMVATCAHAAFPLTAERYAALHVPGTLGRSLAVGRRVREALAAGADPVAAAADEVGGAVLFRGTVAGIDWSGTGGYMEGTTRIDGTGDFGGASADVWFRSEERRVGKECRSRWSPYH